MISIFQLPTIGGLAKLITETRLEDRVARVPPLFTRKQGDKIPLSIAQEKLWSLSRFRPDLPLFNIATAIRFRGNLNIDALIQSINQMIGRHESLRTTFAIEDGKAFQRVHPPFQFDVSVFDLANLCGEEQIETSTELATHEANRPFDIAREPMIRGRLLRYGKEDHVLLWTMNHMMFDWWSMAVLLQEASLLYEALCADGHPQLPYMTFQFADYAVWQRKCLQDHIWDSHLAYWKKKLGHNITPLLQYGTERNTSSGPSFITSTRSMKLPEILCRDIRSFNIRERSTLFITLLTAFKALLHNYTAQEDIRVGTLVANRNLKGTQNLIGLLVNTLILRTNLSLNTTFRELLKRVRETATEAYMFQHLPFELIVETLERENAVDRASLIQVMFLLQNEQIETVRISNLDISWFEPNNKLRSYMHNPTTFDLICSITERKNEVSVALEYKINLFGSAVIDIILNDYLILLEKVIANPEAPLSALNIHQ